VIGTYLGYCTGNAQEWRGLPVLFLCIAIPGALFALGVLIVVVAKSSDQARYAGWMFGAIPAFILGAIIGGWIGRY
jgi:hypothetical protein